MTMIKLNGVSKFYGDSFAVRKTSLDFEKGNTSVLIGPSGCGKTTILKMIAGLERPSEGSVQLNGETLGNGNLPDLRRKMGYVIQDGGLFPHLSAKDNVTLMAKDLKYSKPQIEDRVKELLEVTHFRSEYLDRFPSELSGGQIQRVALMRALMLDPDVLLLDEPLGALDPIVRSSLQDELKEMFEKLKKTTIFVTHDMAEAEFLGDHIVLMKQGSVMQEGSIKDIYQNPKDEYVSTFLKAQRRISW